MTKIGPFKTPETAVPYEVELHAFGEAGETLRMVYVPVEDLGPEPPLGPIWQYGQNDFQAAPVRSLCVGDIIRAGDRRYVIKGMGFAEVPADWVTPTREASPGSLWPPRQEGDPRGNRVGDLESRWGLAS